MSAGLLLAAVIGDAAPILSVQIIPGFISDSSPTCPVTSGPADANASGGRTPYTYLWERASGGAGIVINSPTSAVTTFSKIGPGFNSGVIRCTVTDANNFVRFDEINVELECGGV